MNLFKELNKLMKAGIKPIIEFTSLVEDLDSGAECGMRGVVESIRISRDDNDCFEVTINMEKYFEYNKQLMTHTWLNKSTGEYDVTSIEGGWYPKNHVVEIFDSVNDQDEYNFILLTGNSEVLYDEYFKEKNRNELYVNWLERKLTETRNKS